MYSLPSQSSPDLSEIFSRTFSIRGSSNAPVAYWVDVAIGFNFLVSPGLKLMITSTDQEKGLEESNCILEKRCVVA